MKITVNLSSAELEKKKVPRVAVTQNSLQASCLGRGHFRGPFPETLSQVFQVSFFVRFWEHKLQSVQTQQQLNDYYYSVQMEGTHQGKEDLAAANRKFWK